MVEPATALAIASIGSSVFSGLKGGGGGGGGQFKPPSAEQINEMLGLLPDVNIKVPGVEEFFAPLSVSSPSFSFSGGGGDFSFKRTQPSVALDTFDRRIEPFFQGIDDLRSRFAPGFSELREARLSASTNARQRGLSNLRDSLARRRIQGSSFARAEQTQAEREFAELEASEQAKSFLEEVAINTQLFEVERQAFTQLTQRALVDLEEFKAALTGVGISAQVGTAHAQLETSAQIAEQTARLDAVVSIINSLNTQAGANQRLMDQLNAENAAGFGQGLGFLLAGLLDGRGGGGTTSSGGGGGSISNPVTAGNISGAFRIPGFTGP